MLNLLISFYNVKDNLAQNIYLLCRVKFVFEIELTFQKRSEFKVYNVQSFIENHMFQLLFNNQEKVHEPWLLT